MIRINDIIDKVLENNLDADIDLIEKAYIYSARVHDGQTRLSGEPYLTHPLEVAGILVDMNLDEVSIAAALLHDVIEDTHATAEEITALFGKNVSNIVEGVTKISKLKFQSAEARQAESIRKMMLAMADDIRVILIKLADRLHNIRTIQFHKTEEKKIKIAQETFDIYVPMASRLGIYWIKKELEDTSFKYIMPDEYEKIRRYVNTDQEEKERSVNTIKEILKKTMAENKFECAVLGRYKQYYSIYNKMVKQNIAFDEVYDVIAFRIILETNEECYRALSPIHGLWKPIQSRFKDYIASPKPNMYQSLHTTVIGPEGKRIEIQIRTKEMDRVAKSGIAAHWSYKENKKYDEKTGRVFAWIQEVVENQQNVRSPAEFMENVKIDLFDDEVYVFTPNGEVKTLPKGATPVDFAYNIHTEVGAECVGAKVNGRIVTLKYELKTGDTVHIKTQKGHNPSKDWLSFVKTVKARSKIRQWIKSEERKRSYTIGKEVCEAEFRKKGLNFNKLVQTDKMLETAESFGLKTIEELVVNVGYGKITYNQVIGPFKSKTEIDKKNEKSILDKLIRKNKKKKIESGITVEGIDDMLIRHAKCCNPVPGDPIIGYITLGQGVTVHRRTCLNALKISSERQVPVAWKVNKTDNFPAKIKVLSQDKIGLLGDITTNISKTGANITDAQMIQIENNMYQSNFTIGVKDVSHLKNVIAAIKKLRYVKNVIRIKG